MLCLDTMVRHIMRCDSIKRKNINWQARCFFLDVRLGVKFGGNIYLDGFAYA